MGINGENLWEVWEGIIVIFSRNLVNKNFISGEYSILVNQVLDSRPRVIMHYSVLICGSLSVHSTIVRCAIMISLLCITM